MSLNVLIGLICTVLGVVISWLGFSRSKQKDDQREGKHDGVMLTEIGYIKSGIDDIKAEQREQRKINMEVTERLVAVEASAKQAHRRIDALEERGA